MEETSGRSTNPVEYLRRGSGICLRTQSNEERPNLYSNKPGKTTNFSPTKTRLADNKVKRRYLREPVHSSGSKSTSASSSKAPVRKNYEEKQKSPFLSEVDNGESSNRRTEVRRLQSGKKAVIYEDEPSHTQHTDSEGSSSATTTEGLRAPDLEVLETSVSSGISAHTVIVRNNMLSAMPSRQKDKEELNSGRPQGTSTFGHRRTVPESSTTGVKSSSSSTASIGLQRRGLRNLGCTSISDVLSSSCSSSDSVRNRRVDLTKKRTYDSSRSRGISGQASLGLPPAIYPGNTGPRARARAAEQSSQQAARTSSISIQDSADSLRTRRPTQRTSERMPGEREEGVFPLHESVTMTRVHHPERGSFSRDDVSPQRLARPFYAELPHAIYSSNRQGSTSHMSRRGSSSRPAGSPPQVLHGIFRERDGYRSINMEGIAEVLLALDRIEQDDELTYEQLLVLETNLLLSGLGLHDQHQDMRLDIDNMSYEELLALEEQIGSVSTALSDEQFAKCVYRSVYKARYSEREVNRIVVDDVKCSICQEEYIEGEEIGRMQCEHQYHVCCIHEWLRQKNWCPICKASAIPSEVDKGST